MANFFRTFLPVYSEIAVPLKELLKDTKGKESISSMVGGLPNSFYESENRTDLGTSATSF